MDSDLLRRDKSSKELIVVKDLSLDKIVEELLFYHTLKLIVEAHKKERAIVHVCDLGTLTTTIFFVRLHLHGINRYHARSLFRDRGDKIMIILLCIKDVKRRAKDRH